MSRLLYASYGSNLHPLRLGERVPSAELLGAAELHGWSLRFHKRSNVDGSAKCSIVGTGPAVLVAVYRMRAGEKPLLDTCEGLGQGYDEMTVTIPPYGECFTYIASATHVDDGLVPLDWYREMVRLGCEYNRFPADYVAGIRAVDAMPDPDRCRAERQWDLVRRMVKSESRPGRD